MMYPIQTPSTHIIERLQRQVEVVEHRCEAQVDIHELLLVLL